MTNSLKTISAVVLATLLVGVTFTFAATIEKMTSLSSSYESLNHFIALSAVDDSTTSSALSIAGAKKAQVYFAYTNPVGSGNGTSTFSVEVSPNGTDWYDYNKLISNVANTNSQDVTRVASVVMSATTSAMYALDLENDTFRDMRCVAAMLGTTTAKTADCEITVEF